MRVRRYARPKYQWVRVSKGSATLLARRTRCLGTASPASYPPSRGRRRTFRSLRCSGHLKNPPGVLREEVPRSPSTCREREPEELVAYVQRALGYSIAGDMREEVFFLLGQRAAANGAISASIT